MLINAGQKVRQKSCSEADSLLELCYSNKMQKTCQLNVTHEKMTTTWNTIILLVVTPYANLKKIRGVKLC